MKVTRIKEGIYKVVDTQGSWIAKRIYSTDSKKFYWAAWECETAEETTDDNSWAVAFPTFKALKEYASLTDES